MKIIFSGYKRCIHCQAVNMTFQQHCCDHAVYVYGAMVDGVFQEYNQIKTAVENGEKLIDATHAGLEISCQTFKQNLQS